MIQTNSTTIRRKEMDAVLTCMVDERIGPGELNERFISLIKEFFGCDGAVALRTPEDALKYALKCMGLEQGKKIMISALAPAWHFQAVENLGYEPVVLDVDESTSLVTKEAVHEGMVAGGQLLLLHETMGIMPDVQGILELGVPVIEDISKSAGAALPGIEENGKVSKPRKAGSFGFYSILGLEETDVITAGGGAVLMASSRKEWMILKRYVEQIAKTSLLPDINCALGWVQLKEFNKNEAVRKEIFSLYQKSCMSGRHKMLLRNVAELADSGATGESLSEQSSQSFEKKDDSSEKQLSPSTMCAFPVVLASPFKDVKQYASKKEIEIRLAFEDSVIALKEDELSASCIKAKSLYLRCAIFPLYPRLTHLQVAKIVKVLGTLP